MSDTVLASLVAALSAVLVALVGVFGAKIHGRIRAVQHEVQNDHSTNMRVEQDERHAENRRWFELINRRLIAGDERMGRLEAVMYQHERQLDELEDTIQPKKERPT